MHFNQTNIHQFTHTSQPHLLTAPSHHITTLYNHQPVICSLPLPTTLQNTHTTHITTISTSINHTCIAISHITTNNHLFICSLPLPTTPQHHTTTPAATITRIPISHTHNHLLRSHVTLGNYQPLIICHSFILYHTPPHPWPHPNHHITSPRPLHHKPPRSLHPPPPQPSFKPHPPHNHTLVNQLHEHQFPAPPAHHHALAATPTPINHPQPTRTTT